ncbi:unnamed protein product, partial [Medioppia subpectinata]
RVVSNRRVCRNRDLLLVGHRLAIQLIVFLHVFRLMAVSHCLLIGSTHSSQTGGIVRRHARVWYEMTIQLSSIIMDRKEFSDESNEPSIPSPKCSQQTQEDIEIIFVSIVWFREKQMLFIGYTLRYKAIVCNTEIDWSTYVEQVQCFLNGSLNYSDIKGETGPIVYPAGHLYIYTILYYLTNRGTNILCAQYLFAFIYLITLFAVFRIYHKMDSKLPPFAFVFMCCTSYRIHSIYVLRLFNDTIAMALLYIAINFFIDRKWTFGSVFYRLALIDNKKDNIIAVSVKMNVLLFAPALLLLLLETNHIRNTIANISVCAFIQLAIGLPFLLSHPKSYIWNSFNFGRVFEHKWTVNWRFVANSVFVSHYFHITLLALHLIALLILLTLFTANFIGMAFSRSLHYQFYVWYFHSLPFLLWTTSYSPKTKLCILGLIELSWNTYPSTHLSSGLLHVVHLIILIGHKCTSCTL